jgi:hypothetical protein
MTKALQLSNFMSMPLKLQKNPARKITPTGLAKTAAIDFMFKRIGSYCSLKRRSY